MRISSFDCSGEVLIIAEIGNNHEGKLDVAQQLVHRAADCGVHAVKFQTYQTEHYVSRSDAARFGRLKSFELSHDQFSDLASLAHSLGLLFISTPLDLGSATFLESIVDCFKIASGDNNFRPLIAQIAGSNKPMIVSSGLATLAEIQAVVDLVRLHRAQERDDLAILHCVSSYPVPAEQVNLRSIPFLQARLGIPVGYSDHTLGLEASLAAAALGARIIEKHFTLDKSYSQFRDHQLSADPSEMCELVNRIRVVSEMLGQDEKESQPCEEGLLFSARRSIVAGAYLSAGHRLTMADLTWIRPGGGLAPGDEHLLIGKTLRRDMQFGEPLTPDAVI